MFKFETAVATLVSIALSTAPVYAATTTAPNMADSMKAFKDAGCDIHTKDSDPACADLYKRILPSGGSDSDCKSLEDSYLKVKGEYSDACDAANIGGNCAEALDKCNDAENDLREDKGTSRRSRDANKPLDVNGAKDKYEKCPYMAGQELDKYEKEVKEQEKKVSKLEKEVPELQEKANKVLNSTNEKLQQMKTDMVTAQKEHAKELQQIDQDKQAAEKQITDQITGIQAQISKAQDALGQVSLTKLEGQLKLKQTKTQADLNCHASASAQVSKMQGDVLTATNMGTYNRSGFTGLLKNVGLSDRAQWQRVAKKYYQWCLESKPTMDTKDGANDGYNLLVAQANKSANSIRQQISQLQAQQLQLANPQACGQPTAQANGSSGGETSLCQAARNAYQKAQQSEADYRATYQSATEKYASLQQQGNREYQGLADQAKKKNQEIQDEKSRLENLKQYLQAKYDAGASGNVDSKASSKAAQKRNLLVSTGKDLISCKVNNSTVSVGDSDYCSPDKLCKSIFNFLKNDLRVPDDQIPVKKDTQESVVVPSEETTPTENQRRTNDPDSLTPAASTSK